MGNDSVNAFAKKCGVSRGTINNIINQRGSHLTESTRVFENLDDLLNTWEHAYRHDHMAVTIEKDGICHSALHPRAERCALIKFRLITAENVCDTYALIYYVEIKRGKVVALDVAFDKESFRDSGFEPVLHMLPGMETYVYKPDTSNT